MWQLQHGHQAEARDDLLAGFTLARSSSQDGTLIAALVQIAAENICYSIIAENFYQFSPETLEQLLKGFDAAPARSTIADCIESERAFFRDWLVNKIRGWQQAYPGNDAKVMAEIHDIVASTEGEEEGKANQVSLADRVSKAAGGTSEGVLKLLEQEEPFYQRITAILALPPAEYESQIKAFMADVQASPNPFIQPFFNSWEKCRAREYVMMIRQAQVRAGIELKLRGQEAFRSVSDPLGNGPFALSRFNFEGVDRGFELKSAYEGKYPNTLIFVEKDGPPFRLEGPNAGKPVTTP
jgi:hypothetical protein